MKEIEKIKRQLLQETNYRCGYCMKNITPRMYYIEYDATNLLFLISNIIKQKFCELFPEIPKFMSFFENIELGKGRFNNHEIFLNNQGTEFYQKFVDVYEYL